MGKAFEMNLENYVEMTKLDLEEVNIGLVKARESFDLQNAYSFLEWNTKSMMLLAAKQRVLRQVLQFASVANNLDDLKGKIRDQAIATACYGGSSTDQATNLINQLQVQVWAELVRPSLL